MTLAGEALPPAFANTSRSPLLSIPPTMDQINLVKFISWISARGANIIPSTNEWEVLRFQTEQGVAIIHKNRNRKLSFNAQAENAFLAYFSNQPWRAFPAGGRPNKFLSNLKTQLASRDGWTCCYCQTALDETTATLEHFLSLTHGGTNHVANLGLSCQPCNQAAGNLPVRQKLTLALQGAHKCQSHATS